MDLNNEAAYYLAQQLKLFRQTFGDKGLELLERLVIAVEELNSLLKEREPKIDENETGRERLK